MQQLWAALGPEGSKYVIWLGVGLAIAFGVIILIWLLMKLFGRNLNISGGGGRGQPQRLGITGAFAVDRKGRKLVIVRRDNVEHLILIGGPNDVLVESNIVRAQGAARPQVARDVPDITETQLAPPAPVVAPPPAPVAPLAPVATPVAAPPPAPKPAPLPPPPPARAVPPPPAPPPVQVAPPQPSVQVAPPPPPPVQAAPPPRPVASPPVQAPPPVVEAAAVAAEPAPKPAADPRLSDMAKRLQNVLQRPLTPTARQPAATPPPVAPAAPAAPVPPALPQGKTLSPPAGTAESPSVDSLEEEMARLLGRTDPGKK